MPETSVPKFLECLTVSRLLSDEQVEQLRVQVKSRGLGAAELADVLVRQKHLTDWQARQLLKGQTGFILDHYRLLNPVGRGGMGHVFRGLDVRTGAVVAVKVMARKLAKNETLVSRFQREIRASLELNSPHIVRTLDAGRVGRVDFMVMEYVNGDQVDRIANRLGRLPAGLACSIARQIALGLQHAYERHMVHRDIKPGNMMIHWRDDGTGIAKLMDMGLVLVVNDDQQNSVTRTGQVMGTPDYMSPEQGWDTTQVDIRSDIYSLGCTLFRLLTGTIPFSGNNPVQVLTQRLQRDAPSVLSVCDDLPPGLADVVAKMTRRDPEQRYQTPQEVAEALESWCEPLQKTAFQQAVRKSASSADNVIADPRSDEIDESDRTYQRFLSEVEKGSRVDLMVSTVPADGEQIQTLPQLVIEPSSAVSGAYARPSVGRSRYLQKSRITLAVAGALVLFFGTVVLLSGGSSQPAGSGSAGPEVVQQPERLPVSGRIVSVGGTEVQQGQSWTYAVQTETQNVTGQVVLETGETAPVGVRLDADGVHLTWDVPESQSTGEYSIPLRMVHRDGDTIEVLDEQLIKVRVLPRRIPVRLPDLPRQRLGVGQPFELSVAVPEGEFSVGNLIYRLSGDVPRGVSLNPKTGMLTWVPEVRDMGRHAFEIAVLSADSNEVLDHQRLQLVVIPTRAEHILPPLPRQQAVAGKRLIFRFPAVPDDSETARLTAMRTIDFATPPPPGARLSADARTFVWDVPSDVVGEVRIPFQVGIRPINGARSPEMIGTVILTVEVSAAPRDIVAASMPSADEIEKALSELKTTYKPRLLAARTPAQKAALAAELLEVAVTATPGAADAALLQLIEDELAIRSRAVDVLFQVAHLRSVRYGVDELEAAQKTVGLFRKTSLDVLQQDIAIEHCLRLALNAAETDDVELTSRLLKMALELLGNSAPPLLLDDLKAAEKITAELKKSPDAAVLELQRKEVQRLLSSWQFQPLLAGKDGLLHFAVARNGGEQPSGAELWKIVDGHVQLKSESLPAHVGFLLREDLDQYVLRFDVMADTTSALCVVGAIGSDDDDFVAWGVGLDVPSLGRISNIRTLAPVATPSVPVPAFKHRANRVEVLVRGTTIAVRVNGTPVSSANIPTLTRGKPGFAADLSVPEPRVELRNVRVLRLPE